MLRGFIHAAVKQQAVPLAHAWRMAWDPPMKAGEQDLRLAVESLIRKGVVKEKEGRVWLADRNEQTLRGLTEHDALVARKWRLAKAMANYLAWVPGVRAVAVCNALAWGAVSEESDIDLAIVARHGVLWLVRLTATLPLMLLRLRPGEAKRDPICLSFFVSDTQLNLGDLARKEGDAHFPYWIVSMIPLVDDGVWKLVVEANAWTKEHIPHMAPLERLSARISVRRPGFFAHWLWKIGQSISLWMWVEWWAHEAQMKHFPDTIKTVATANDTRVVLSSTRIKLHTSDDREAIHAFWEERCRVYGV